MGFVQLDLNIKNHSNSYNNKLWPEASFRPIDPTTYHLASQSSPEYMSNPMCRLRTPALSHPKHHLHPHIWRLERDAEMVTDQVVTATHPLCQQKNAKALSRALCLSSRAL